MEMVQGMKENDKIVKTALREVGKEIVMMKTKILQTLQSNNLGVAQIACKITKRKTISVVNQKLMILNKRF
jgi:hypothetical protein